MRRGSRFDMGAGRYSAYPAGPILGPELMTNGDCGSATGWNDLGSGGTFSVSGGVMASTAQSVMLVSNDGANSGIEEGKTYRCVYTISSLPVPSGGVLQRIGLGEGVARTATGTYTEDIVAQSIEDEGSWRLSNVTGSVTVVFDNFSCREVLP